MLKISDLIKELEEFKEKHGDLIVVSKEDGFGGYAMLEAAGLCEYTEGITGYEVAHGGEDGSVTDEMIYSLFPNWDGNHDELENDVDEKYEAKIAILATGNLIYST
tara:strand:- start:28736 stop:29053 length:318 start_codon:yes stop_codon:yes gene_type:complete